MAPRPWRPLRVCHHDKPALINSYTLWVEFQFGSETREAKTIDCWIQFGMEPVGISTSDPWRCFLPHHQVYTPQTMQKWCFVCHSFILFTKDLETLCKITPIYIIYVGTIIHSPIKALGRKPTRLNSARCQDASGRDLCEVQLDVSVASSLWLHFFKVNRQYFAFKSLQVFEKFFVTVRIPSWFCFCSFF